jgi:hypothetical protein
VSAREPDERSLIAQIAINERLSRGGGAKNTEAARLAKWEKYLRQVDPEGVLTPDERERRAGFARKADMARLSLKAAQARRNASKIEESW